MQTTIVLGVDGSEPSERAVKWCATYGPALGAVVVVVYAIDLPLHATAAPYAVPSLMTPEERDELLALVTRDWCKALSDAGVEFRVELMDGNPARALIDAARTADATFVVTGRRGRGGFAELLLGSTSHHLSHHLDRTLVIVP
jgi:nucleotide-binding universal stress UspA family protein